jgi:polyketide cyclase/dehydrase/lipid transport protein
LARYSFLTTWLLAAPVEPVWEAIYDCERWPEWWRGVTRVEAVSEKTEGGVGQVFDIAWRSFIPYELEFRIVVTRVEHLHLMEGEAAGDLAGRGRWRLFSGPDATAVTYEWNVATTKRWMNVVAPFAGPIFRWNHDWVMGSGGRGLAEFLDVPLLART